MSATNNILTVHGLEGVGIDHQGTETNRLYNWIDLATSQTWQATNAAGGGFAITVPLQGRTNIGSHTLTVDLVNALNTGQLDRIVGTGDLVKTGLGTLTLTGDSNLFTGGTLVEEGTLALTGVGSIANSSQVVADGTFDISGLSGTGTSIQRLAGGGAVTLGTKDLTLTNANDLFSGTISGDGGLTIAAGTQILAGANTYAGATTVQSAATLAAGAANTFSNASAFGVLPGASLDLADFSQTVASLDNAGRVTFGSVPGTTLAVTGNYISNGGRLDINAVLGDDSSLTDRLVIGGDSVLTGGATQVFVTNLGGAGAPTVEGIKIIDVSGASAVGAFSLVGDYVFEGEQAVVGGAYAYRLYQNGVSTPVDGDWYLRSALIMAEPPVNPPAIPPAPAVPLYQPGVPIYESYANILLGFNSLGTLQQRVGNRSWSGAGFIDAGVPAHGTIQGNGAWGRIEAERAKFDPRTSTSGAQYVFDLWKLQAGIDGSLYDGEAGRLVGGITGHYGTISSDINSIFGDGSISSTGYGLGGTLTWYAYNGFYLDGQAQVSWYDSDLSSRNTGLRLTRGNNGLGYSLSIEGGQKIVLGRDWSITPQAQMAYSEVNFDDFTDVFGALVDLDRGGSLKGRLGISADYQNEWRGVSGQISRTHVYGIANLYHEFLEGLQTDVAGIKFTSENDPLWGGIGMGGSYNWADDRYSLFGEASVQTRLDNFADSYTLKGNAGLRVKF